jgi:hypothetical protein
MALQRDEKTVAVVGAGIFGSTAAYKLAQVGFSVTLFDQADDIMTAASAINQYRLHRGYHYPRSVETIKSCLEATPVFEAEYAEAVISKHAHHYAIAKEKSFIDGKTYLRTLDECGLPYEIISPTYINNTTVELVIKADENLYDPFLLKKILKSRLINAGVKVELNTKKEVDDLAEYDHVVVAAYASLNSVFQNQPEFQREYQFEVCEKIIVEIPENLRGCSVVIMDGPFMSFDPLGDTGYAVMGHVEHAIHNRNIGIHPEVPAHLASLLNKGVIQNPEYTNIQSFLDEACNFLPDLRAAKHIGSMYTVRTVLPRVDKTDTRPTIVESIDHRVINIYSGKVGNSVAAANEVVSLISAVNET